MPVRLVAEDSPDTAVVGVRRVNELDFYQFGFRDLADRLRDIVSPNKLVAVIRHLRLQESSQYFKLFQFGKLPVARYSQNALRYLNESVPNLDVEAIWREELHQRAERRRRR
jgi:hypothetical protein